MNRRTAIAALASATVLGGGWILTRPGSTSGLGETLILPGAANAQEAPAADIDTSTIQDMTEGAADAPVEMIEYGSFTCPHCAAFALDQYPQLKRDYIDTGKLRFTFREVYFDRFGLWASMIARCGGEMRFFGISDMLYAQQSEWIAGGQDPAAIAENLRRLGLSAGLDQDALDACLADQEMAQTLVAWYQENATRDGVEATPTLFIDGEKYSNMAYADLAAIIDERLAAAGEEG